jgi:hypothetical protein
MAICGWWHQWPDHFVSHWPGTFLFLTTSQRSWDVVIKLSADASKVCGVNEELFSQHESI